MIKCFSRSPEQGRHLSLFCLAMARLHREPNNDIGPYSYRDFFRFLWVRIGPHRGRFWLATFFRLTGDTAYLYPAYAVASLVTILGSPHTNKTVHQIIIIGIWWGLSTIWRLISQMVSKTVGFRLAEQTGVETQLLTIQHMMELDISWHERENAGNKIKRIDRGTMAINRVIRLWYGTAIEILVNVVGATIIISRTTIGLASSLLVFMAVFLIISTILMRRASVMETMVDQQEENIQGLSFEAVNNLRTVKALGLTSSLSARLRQDIASLLQSINRRIFLFQERSNVLNAWGQIFRFTSMFFIIFGILHHRYELGFLILFQSYFNRLWESVGELSELAPDVVTAKFAVGRLEHILREPVRIEITAGKREFPSDWRELRVADLSFGYGRADVLQHLSFTVRRGERIGIIGLSGAGKTTLFKLFMKEHEGYRGSISFDQAPLIEIEKQSYVRHVASVLQDTEVFNFTLRENIRIANPVGTDAMLTQALDTAHVTGFLPKLPQGIDTIIGEKGFRLSGGEKQRLGIARAVFKQPQLLLLDEATSHLDVESERDIQDSLHRFFQSVTAIVIAHRLTTIKEMDRILVIEGGRLIEMGSFKELYARRGRFHELWEQQRL